MFLVLTYISLTPPVKNKALDDEEDIDAGGDDLPVDSAPAHILLRPRLNMAASHHLAWQLLQNALCIPAWNHLYGTDNVMVKNV